MSHTNTGLSLCTSCGSISLQLVSRCRNRNTFSSRDQQQVSLASAHLRATIMIERKRIELLFHTVHTDLGFYLKRRVYNEIDAQLYSASTSLRYRGKRWATMSRIRQDMVKRAVAFLRHPNVKGALRENQLAFLKGKALTQEEIDEAFRIAAEVPTSSAAQGRVALTAPIKSFRKGAVRSEAVVCRGMVFVSGQTASPAKGGGSPVGESASPTEESDGLVGDEAEQQATKALEKVRGLLESVGSNPSRVVSALIHVRSLEQDLAGFDKAWSRWIDKETPPVRTVVQVDSIDSSGAESSTGLRVSVSVTAFL